MPLQVLVSGTRVLVLTPTTAVFNFTCQLAEVELSDHTLQALSPVATPLDLSRLTLLMAPTSETLLALKQ
jgi:hypothetical protein